MMITPQSNYCSNNVGLPPEVKKNCYKKPIKILRFCLVFLCLIATFGLSAQQIDDPNIQKISQEILELIRKNLHNRSAQTPSDDVSTADELFNITEPDLELTNNDDIHRYKIQKLKKDIGINLKAQYNVNQDQSFDAEDASDSNLSGARTRVGLEWNILREGWLGHQQKANRMEKQRKLDNLKFELEQNDTKLYYRYNLMIYLFNEEKIRLLSAREAQLIEQQKLLYQVYFLKGILYEEIIKIKSSLEQVKVQLKNYRDYNEWFESTLGKSHINTDFAVDELPVMHVNLDYLLHENSKDVLLDSINRLEEDIALSDDKAINDIALRVQTYRNLNTYRDDARDTRSFNSVGVSLSVPMELFFNKNTKDQLAYAKIRKRESFNKYEALNTQSEIINYYYEYNYKMKTYMEFIHKEILYKEKIRVEVVNQRNYKDIYRSLRILRHLDVLRNIQAEMLDLKQQMYLLLLKIYGKTHYETIQDFVRPLNVDDFYQRLPGARLMSITRQDLNENQPDFIRDYLMTNGIRHIVLEEGLNTNDPKVMALKQSLVRQKFQLARKFSGQKLLSSTQSDMQVKHALVVENFDGVVLDFSNYNSAGQRLEVQNYLISQFDMFSQENLQNDKTTRFHIILSSGYPIEFLNVLAKTCDMISFKIQNPKDLGYFETLNANGFTGMDKICLDLQKHSFQDRLELEAYIDMLSNVYHIKHITINGLNNFLTIDTKTIMKQE